MKPEDIDSLDWGKGNGLLPAIVQHARTGSVLMLGYMSPESLRATLEGGRVVFFSRTRERLWTKGETSGHVLDVVSVSADCDADTLLVLAEPSGPVCHTGSATCFADQPPTDLEALAFLVELEAIIASRLAHQPPGSYTARLFAAGPSRIAQKIGEEGVELALAAARGEHGEVIAEAADLLYHVLLLLKSRDLSLARVVHELESRHESRA